MRLQLADDLCSECFAALWQRRPVAEAGRNFIRNELRRIGRQIRTDPDVMNAHAQPAIVASATRERSKVRVFTDRARDGGVSQLLRVVLPAADPGLFDPPGAPGLQGTCEVSEYFRNLLPEGDAARERIEAALAQLNSGAEPDLFEALELVREIEAALIDRARRERQGPRAIRVAQRRAKVYRVYRPAGSQRKLG